MPGRVARRPAPPMVRAMSRSFAAPVVPFPAPPALANGLSRRDALKWLGLAGGVALAGGGLRAEEPAKAEKSEKPATPSLAGAQAGFYRFKIGELEALALQDGGLLPPADRSPFAIDEPGGSVERALEAALLPTDKVQIPFNVLLVHVGSELVLVDAGGGKAFGDQAGHLPASLASAGLKPEQVTAVIVTHAHPDHVGGLVNAETKGAAFPNAQVFISRREHDFWMQTEPNVGGMAVPAEAAREIVTQVQGALGGLKGKLQLVAGGDKLLGGIEIFDTPGHTPGQLAVVFGSGRDQLLHFADVATHHALAFAQPDWRYAYDGDPATAVETRKKLLDRAAAERLRLFGSHMPFPALGRVRKAAGGGGYDFVPEPFANG